MAKKTGICMNLDCDNYKKEVEVEPGGEFECPVCHQPLREGGLKGNGKKKTGSGNKKVIMIIVGLVIVAAVVVGIIMMSDGNKSDTPAIEKPLIDTPIAVDSVKVDTTVAETPEPEIIEPEKEAEKVKPASPKDGKGTVDLGYGTYTGDLKNGKPHGYGTITYKKSHKIVSSKDFVANPGDTFEGDFRDGKINGLGYWNHDGNKTAVKP